MSLGKPAETLCLAPLLPPPFTDEVMLVLQPICLVFVLLVADLSQEQVSLS